MRSDNVEVRITKLRADLNITSDEESRWYSVARAMRENAANMNKLVAAKRTRASQRPTAVDDLVAYQEFAQAHLSGLKNLTPPLKSLYESMSDPQKKNADRVLQSFRRSGAPRLADLMRT